MTKSKSLLEKHTIKLDERMNYSRIKTPKRKDSKMSIKNQPTVVQGSYTARKNAQKYSKTRIEHSKDIVIAILITAIVTFIVSGNI